VQDSVHSNYVCELSGGIRYLLRQVRTSYTNHAPEACYEAHCPTYCFVLWLGISSFAQVSPDDSPATKTDVERYFKITRSDVMMRKLMTAMSQGVRDMAHEQYLKDEYLKHQDELPADYESKMSSMLDEMFANMPWDEMVQAMVPSYQKHFTKGDIDNLVTFYSSPTGAKVLREMPALTAEAMQAMTPIMTKYVETMQTRLKIETDGMMAQTKKPGDAKAPAARN